MATNVSISIDTPNWFLSQDAITWENISNGAASTAEISDEERYGKSKRKLILVFKELIHK